MDTGVIDHPGPSVSSEGPEQLLKRRKFDISITPSLNISVVPFVPDPEKECERLKKEIVTLKGRLSECEDTVTKLHRIRREIEEIFEKERIMLQLQVKMDTEMIEELRGKLDEATRSNHEALEAKESGELEMSMGNTRPEDNTVLPDSEPTPVSPKPLEDTEFLEKLRIAEEKIIELEEKLEDNMISQTEFDLLGVELQQLMNQKYKIEKTASEQKKILIARVLELEEELKLSKNTISTFHDVVKEVELLKQKELENKAIIVMLQEKNEELSSIITGYEVRESATPYPGSTDVEPSPQQVESIKSSEEIEQIQEDVKDEGADIELIKEKSLFSNDNEEFPAVGQFMDIDKDVEIVEFMSAEKNLEIRVGDHSVLVSDQEFFDINWMDEYIQEADDRYFCKNCGKMEDSSMSMEDHVWIAHYNGFFECPTCSLDSQPCPLGRRDSIGQHMVESHPHLLRFG